MAEEKWKNLKIWQLADQLAFDVYKATENFPRDELYGITSQLRRAALSIPTNIVEGYSRKGDKELTHFLSISFASLAEVKYLIHFAKRLGYFVRDECGRLEASCDELGRVLWSFYSKVRDTGQ